MALVDTSVWIRALSNRAENAGYKAELDRLLVLDQVAVLTPLSMPSRRNSTSLTSPARLTRYTKSNPFPCKITSRFAARVYTT